MEMYIYLKPFEIIFVITGILKKLTNNDLYSVLFLYMKIMIKYLFHSNNNGNYGMLQGI